MTQTKIRALYLTTCWLRACGGEGGGGAQYRANSPPVATSSRAPVLVAPGAQIYYDATLGGTA